MPQWHTVDGDKGWRLGPLHLCSLFPIIAHFRSVAVYKLLLWQANTANIATTFTEVERSRSSPPFAMDIALYDYIHSVHNKNPRSLRYTADSCD